MNDAVAVAVDYAKFYSRSHDAVTRVYDEAGNVIETHEHKRDFQRIVNCVGSLLIVADHLRPRFAQFKLCAHFL